MNNQRTTTIITNLRWGAFFVVLLFLVTHVIPRALGQRGQQTVSKRPSHVEAPSRLDGGNWTLTGSLNTGRADHTATLLPTGIVLVAGGVDSSGVLASAELYDPASGNWTPTGDLNGARDLHTATLLSNGIVLVAAGLDSTGSP